MGLTKIETLDDLKHFLKLAMQLEHATIPPYLTAMYSLKPGTNSDAAHVIRAVAVEEMLHLTLAANMFNAIGGQVDFTVPDFVPNYPAYLPDGEDDFQVGIASFSKDTIGTFLKIERPKAPSDERPVAPEHHVDVPPDSARAVRKAPPGAGTQLVRPDKSQPDIHFYSIGEFYREIKRGFERLHKSTGDKLFCGDPAWQIGPEYYYSGGARLHKVTDLGGAKRAIDLISEQGEGYDEGIFGIEGELAHYYRFNEIMCGRYYLKADDTKPASPPSGAELQIDWNAVFPIKPNAKLSDYQEGWPVRQAAIDFANYYADFLKLLTQAFNGQPQLFIQAVACMMEIRNKIGALVRNPLPDGSGLHAGPVFRLNP